MIEKEEKLFDGLIVNQIEVINNIQSLMLSGKMESKEEGFFYDYASRIKVLAEGLSYLMGCREGITNVKAIQEDDS